MAPAILSLALLAAPLAGHAQTTDRVLSEATIFDGDKCAVVGIGLNLPVQLVSSFPTGHGDELRIRVSPIEGGVSMIGVRESLRPPKSDLAGIAKIEFEGDRPEGPTLTITFERPVYFQLGQGADFRSFVLAISGDQPNPECLPTEKRPLDMAAKPVDAALPAATTSAPDSTMSEADRALLTDARAALTGGDYPRAIQLLTRLVEQPSGPASREARELLGLARERNGQLAHAKGEYETYLRLYPEGPDSDRVRQRLAALIATGGRPTTTADASSAKKPAGEWRAGGSFSSFYMRDESYEQIDDSATSTTTTVADVNLNQLLSTLDTFAAYSSPGLKMKLRATGSYTQDFRPGADNIGALSALYLEAYDPSQNYYGRIGRQNRSTGGVLGRFDGLLVSARLNSTLKLEGVAGAPVDTPKDLSIDSSRRFYGASLVFGRFFNAFDGDLYVIEQKASGQIDRRAVGAELRYVEKGRSVFTALDYDVHFSRLNFALINGSWAYGQGGTVSFAADYRHSPLLFTTNALLGQTVFNLDDLRGLYSDAEIKSLALDRSAESRSLSLGVSQPLTQKLSLNLDATASDVSATPASGGVPASPASGTEYYYSVQLIGSSLFKEGDIGILGLRYADTASANRWVVDINTRYPWSRELRFSPRLRVSYRESKTSDETQISVRPSFRVNYNPRGKLQYEIEFGGEWLQSDSSLGRDTTRGYFINAGIRRDF
jgi:hypothetical protein